MTNVGHLAEMEGRLQPGPGRGDVGRQSALTLDTTYELSLAILFLDRLGESVDRPLIQAFALRLIAGQCPTGGWSYKCPLLTLKDQQDLLTVLEQLEPKPHFDPV